MVGMEKWLTVRQFAELIDRSVARVHFLISSEDERLETLRPGHEYLISKASAANFPKKKAQTAPKRPKALKSKRRNGTK